MQLRLVRRTLSVFNFRKTASFVTNVGVRELFSQDICDGRERGGWLARQVLCREQNRRRRRMVLQ